MACGAVLGAVLSLSIGHGQAVDLHEVDSVRVILLSTMLTETGIGEWGFSALVEADGHRILFDAGSGVDTVWRNAEALEVDLSGVRDVVLSHHHGDHSGGLIFLRRKFHEQGSDSVSRLHAGRGIFRERAYGNPDWTDMRIVRDQFRALGGSVEEHAAPTELYPGVWLTGPVPRVHPEKNYGNPFRPSDSPGKTLSSPDGPVVDTVPEDLSLVINTRKGLVVISGCAHAGMINIFEYAREIVRPVRIHAAIGGFHLLNADDSLLEWTAGELQRFGLENLVGAHCTGLEPVYRFRELLNLDRQNAVVGAVGATFSLDDGIDPLRLAH